MNKVVIAGSASLKKEIKQWVQYWNNQKDCKVLNYPKTISTKNLEKEYPKIHNAFLEDITKADILFIANEPKKGIIGYIGAQSFAELELGLAQKLIYKKNIKLIIANMPSKEVGCYEEISTWLKLGWIDEILNKTAAQKPFEE